MPRETKGSGRTANELAFMVWLSTPKSLREIRTEKDYCKARHVSPKTLLKWRRSPGFWPEVQELTKDYLAEAIPEALDALKNMAIMGSFQHLKLYLEMTGMYVPKIAPTTPDGLRPYGSISDGELQAAIDKELAAFIASRGATE